MQTNHWFHNARHGSSIPTVRLGLHILLIPWYIPLFFLKLTVWKVELPTKILIIEDSKYPIENKTLSNTPVVQKNLSFHSQFRKWLQLNYKIISMDPRSRIGKNMSPTKKTMPTSWKLSIHSLFEGWVFGKICILVEKTNFLRGSPYILYHWIGLG